MIEHWLYYFLGKDIANTLGNIVGFMLITLLPLMIGAWLATRNRL